MTTNAKFTFSTEYSGSKTYATEANMDKAVAKFGYETIRHFSMKTPDGRFFPVFVGMEAIDKGVHFNFHCIG